MNESKNIKPEYVEFKKEHEIKVDDNKIKIETNKNEIIFNLIIDLSVNKYIKRFKYEEFRNNFGISEEKDIKEIFNDLINYEYEINENEKKIIFNDDKEIKFEEESNLTNEEMIKELIF